jgi:hypothetical protein
MVNIRRGLFRTWVVTSAFWIAGVGAFAVAVVPGMLADWKYQYVAVMRPEIDVKKADFSRPFYELMVPPLKVRSQPRFLQIEPQHLSDWDKRAQDGGVDAVSFADGSSLYVQSDMTKEDADYLIQNFWAARWYRWIRFSGGWALIGLGPALAVLITGSALIWVVRGFADDQEVEHSERVAPEAPIQ